MEDMAKKRPLSANDVAEWFINRTASEQGEVISTLEVQRLVYFSQAWYLANKGRPLFEDEFEAWASGPMNPAIFERFANFAYTNIPAIETSRVIKGAKLELLEEIWERYGCFKGRKLDAMSREPGGPWQTARGNLTPEAAGDTVIPKSAIRKFYAKQIEKSWPEDELRVS